MQIKTFTYKQIDGKYWLDGRRLSMDAHVTDLMNAGWELFNSSDDGGHVRVGQTLGKMALTGGLSLFFGADRTAKSITLTFKNEGLTAETAAIQPRPDGFWGKQALAIAVVLSAFIFILWLARA